MAFAQISIVKFTRNRHCFISIPRKWSGLSSGDTVMVTSPEESKSLFASWNGEYSKGDFLELSGLFGATLGFKDGDDVIVKVYTKPTVPCTRCVVEPVSENDWEVLSSNSQAIESNLLNQIRIISAGLQFPVWITGNIFLYVKVVTTFPSEPCSYLQEMTEVVVSPPGTAQPNLQENVNMDNDLESTQSSLITSMISSFSSYFSGDSNVAQVIPVIKGFEALYTVSKDCKYDLLRVLPQDILGVTFSQFNTVYINPGQFTSSTRIAIAKLNIILSPSDRNLRFQLSTKDTAQRKETDPIRNESHYLETYVKVLISEKCPLHCIVPCDTLRRQLGLSISSRVYISPVEMAGQVLRGPNSSVQVVKKIPAKNLVHLRPLVLSKITKQQIAQSLTDYLIAQDFLVCAKGTLISAGGQDFLVDSDEPCFVVNSTFSNSESNIDLGPPLIELIKTAWGTFLPFRTIKEVDSKTQLTVEPKAAVTVGGVHETYEQLKTVTLSYLGLNETPLSYQFRGSILLCGMKGSGKKTLIKKLSSELSSSPKFVFTVSVDCKQLKAKRIESLYKELVKSFTAAYYRQPSLIVLHDLDILVPSPTKPEQEGGIEALHHYRISLILLTMMRLIEAKSSAFGRRVVVIATARSRKSVHENLVFSKGRHFFTHTVELTRLQAHQRLDVISKLLQSKSMISPSCVGELDLNELSTKTEGYLPQDLRMLVNRAIHACLLRYGDQRPLKVELNQEDLKEALSSFTPISLQGIQLKPKSAKTFKDVGGMDEMKRILAETILWPTKYAALYAKCPLRPQTCILLHGLPGTGKTLLVEAVANEFDLNFISVEGPELLSKYIGASEQAVRELFKRAEAAKPCILFFDEFDSIAAQRGIDGTGVTDRIVNQLLTQMDGVEGLERGVFIIAATSRFDLLDPALLRPGRFDKCLHCPLPSESERKQILQVLSGKLQLHDDVDFNLIASATPNYTGADLQSILYTAQIEAFHEKLNEMKSGIIEHSKAASGPLEDIFAADNGDVHSEALERSERKSIGESEVDDTDDEDGEHDEEEEDEAKPRIEVNLTMEHIMRALNRSKPSVNPEEENARLSKRRGGGGGGRGRVTFK
ncbi:Peroxisome biogenesis factor 1 [Halotydeus destructor]|nr:Peroxisome biogenesis factor 1 [Halotydeus destructor]